jgi:hypothetical protein
LETPCLELVAERHLVQVPEAQDVAQWVVLQRVDLVVLLVVAAANRWLAQDKLTPTAISSLLSRIK